MHHVLGEDGKRLFPSGKRLISHWNLRDELKANYADTDGLAKQRTIAKVMERIVTQTIPRGGDRQPAPRLESVHEQGHRGGGGHGRGGRAEGPAAAPRATSASPTRGSRTCWRTSTRRARSIAFSPIAPTPDRARVRRRRDARGARARDARRDPRVAARRGGREGDRAPGSAASSSRTTSGTSSAAASTSEAELDAITRKRYPTADAFAKDLPRILRDLGFTPARAKLPRRHIAVDPSRGAGHAMGAERRGDKAHLRTRVEAGGMDYKGYNIAVHELGHNVEQTFSLYDIDHTLLAGRAEHRVHRGARVPVPGARPRAARPAQARRRGRAPARARRVLEHARDRGLGARRARRLALALRAPDRDRRRAARGDRADRARDLGPLLRADRSAARARRCSASTATRSRRRSTCSTTSSAT